MKFRFACSQCGQQFRVSSRNVGRRFKCPRCHLSLTVPSHPQATNYSSADPHDGIVPGTSDWPNSLHDDDDDAELIYDIDRTTDDTVPSSVPADSDETTDRGIRWLRGVLLVAMGMTAFACGAYFAKDWTHVPVVTVAEAPCVIRGQTTYRTAAGTDAPDDGCAVLAVPADRHPDEKLPIDGLGPNDPPLPHDHPVLHELGVLGGAYTRCDGHGHFQLRVARTGEYFVLWLSRNARRPRGQDPLRKDLAEIGRYVTSGYDLLGSHSYRWTREEFTRDVQLDCEFGLSAE